MKVDRKTASEVRRTALLLSQGAYRRYVAAMTAAIQAGALAPGDVSGWQPGDGSARACMSPPSDDAHAVEGF